MAPHRSVGWAIGCGLIAALAAVATIYWFVGGEEDIRGLRARSRYPRVVLVTFDTLNIWYTSLFSEDGAPTPALESFASDGIWFDHAYTPVPVTLPSHTALLSGRPPWSTGVLVNGDTVPGDIETLPEILSGHGYRTAAFLSLGVLNSGFGLEQGFEEYDDLSSADLNRFYRFADEVLEPAERWIARHAREPFFLWVHLSDPHDPYLPVGSPPDTVVRLDDEPIARLSLGSRQRHALTFELPPGKHRLSWERVVQTDARLEPVPNLKLIGTFHLRDFAVEPLGRGPVERRLDPRWGVDLLNQGSEPAQVELSFTGNSLDLKSSWVRERYRQEVSYADRHLDALRRVFAERGLDSGTLWLIASDHGEGLLHHEALAHAVHVREDQLRTLWLMAGEGLTAGQRFGTPVLTVDFLPTVLEVLGLAEAQDAEGTSQAACWSVDGCPAPRREWVAYGVENKVRRLRALGLYRWPLKALWSTTTESGVFDLGSQPREQEALIGLSDALEPRGATSIDEQDGALIRRLERHIHVFRSILEESDRQDLGAEEREMLKSLGYL